MFINKTYMLVILLLASAPLNSMDNTNEQHQGDTNDQAEPITHLWKQPNTPEQKALKEAAGYRRYSQTRATGQQRRSPYSLQQLIDSESTDSQQTRQQTTEKPVHKTKNKKSISEILATYFSFKQ